MTQAQVDALLTSRPEPKINGNNQYVICKTNYTRCTTFIEPVKNLYNIRLWEKRMVALGLADRPDILAAVGATDATDKKRLDDLCEQAKEAARGNARATIGTALHTYCEWHDKGVARNVPPPWDADVAAYAAAINAAGIVMDKALIEGIVVNTTLNVAGRYDRLAKVPGVDGYAVLDLKTGDSIHLDECAAQESIYANADLAYDPATDTTSPIGVDINKEVGVIVHLPAGSATCTIYTVDLTVGWEMAQACKQIRSWWYGNKSRFGQKLAERSVAKTTDAERRAALVARVETIRDHSELALRDLANNWPQGVATFKDSDAQSVDELDLIEAVLVEVEKQHSVPFPAAPPVDDPFDGIPEPLPRQLLPVVYASREDCDRLIEDLRQLEPDFLAAVEAVTAEAKVPNLKTNKVEPRHLTLVRDVIRGVDITRRLTRLHTEGDEAMHAAFYSYCRISDPAFVDEDAWLNALRVLSALGQTVFFELVGDDTWRLIERPDPAA